MALNLLIGNQPKLPDAPAKMPLKRTTTGVSVSSLHSRRRESISVRSGSEYDADATTHREDSAGAKSRKGTTGQHGRKQPPIEKDAWNRICSSACTK